MPPNSDHFEILHGLGALEDPGQGVIVGSGNGIELVIVTACTAKRLTEKGLANGIDLFIGHFHALPLVDVSQQDLWSNHEEPRGNALPVSLVNRLMGQEVPRDPAARRV